jgi:hypothetical protein
VDRQVSSRAWLDRSGLHKTASSRSSAAALYLPLAQLDAADLARDGLGQLGGELDLARVLVGGGDGAAVLLELGDQGVVGDR